jgi:histidinol-phosphate/aromatic aminotransferase/cobyric acid decarboxylase-like protein
MNRASLSLHRNEYYFKHSPEVCSLLSGPVPAELVSTYATRDMLDQFINRLAQSAGVRPELVTLYHGAEDALFKILGWAAARRMKVHTTSHGWAEYMRLMQGLKLEVCQTPLIELPDEYAHPTEAFEAALASEESSALVLLASPNNPTGHDLPAGELIRLANLFKRHLFLIDRVYTEFAEATFAPFAQCENIITIGSFSKFFGLPGLRVGFAVGKVPAVQSMSLGPSPWALQVCLAALNQSEYYLAHWAQMKKTAENLSSMQTSAGHFLKTCAPFLLFRCRSEIGEEQLLAAQDNAGVRGKIIQSGAQMQIRWSLASDEAQQRIVNCIQFLEK